MFRSTFAFLDRNKRSVQGDRLSAITMALQYESDEEGILSGTYLPIYLIRPNMVLLVRRSSVICCVIFLPLSGTVHYDEGESEAESMTSNIDMSNPIFQLYEAVRGARNSQGQLISEPFLQLPSRKDYPDYYQQISQPVCLLQIKYDETDSDLFSCVCLYIRHRNGLLTGFQHTLVKSVFSKS